MVKLRGEGGCPWDREQTHRSLSKNLIEETYEVIEGIDTEDDALLQEELGDLLLQIVFHAQIASETARFDIDDVADGICKSSSAGIRIFLETSRLTQALQFCATGIT